MMKARLLFTAGVVLSTMLSIPAIAVPASRGTTASAARTAQAQTATMPDGTELWGNVIASNRWSDDSAPVGIYSFVAAENPSIEEVYLNGKFNPRGGGVFFDGKYHFVDYSSYYSNYFYEYNVADWTPTGNNGQYAYSFRAVATDLTYNPADGKVYGCFVNIYDNNWSFGTLDYGTCERTDISLISEASASLLAIAANADGEIYGITQAGDLVKISKDDGNTVTIGATGVEPAAYQQSAAFDMHTGKLYWAAVLSDTSSALYEVSTADGTATKVFDFPNGEEVVALYVPEPDVMPGAPARAAGLNVLFSGSSTTGTVSFAVPVTTYDGNELTGTVGYVVSVNGHEAVSGNAAPGETVNREITVDGGVTRVSVVLNNAEGNSPEARSTVYTGYDEPSAVFGVQLALDAATGLAKVTWDAVTGCVHGGYVSEGGITYDVVRMPDSLLVSSGSTATQFTETLPTDDIVNYSYRVIPVNNEVRGEAAESNSVRIGSSYALPYYEDFADKSVFSLFTVIDANDDGSTWDIDSKTPYYCYDSTNDADDWLITPGIRLGTEHRISLSFRAAPYISNERIAVAYGQGDDPATYIELIAPTDITTDTLLTAEFIAPAEGVWHIGFHALSDKNEFYLYVSDISIENGAQLNAPDSVSGLTVIPAAEAQLQATVNFTAPSMLADGRPIESISRIEVWRDGDILLSTLKDVQPGSECSVPDDGDGLTGGLHTYTVIVFNDKGSSPAAMAVAYIGEDTPLAPREVSLRDNGDGTATLTWTSPGSVGQNGAYVTESGLTYNIYNKDNEEEPAFAAVSGFSHTFSIPQSGAQAQVSYGVAALSAAGESEMALSRPVIVGEAYSLPFHESFAGKSFVYGYWGITSSGYWSFDFATLSSDDDGGSMSFSPSKVGDTSTLSSGKISMEGTTNPKLMFSLYNQGRDPEAGSTIDVIVDEAGTGETVTVTTIDVSALPARSWQPFTVSLADFVDLPYVSISFLATCNESYSTVNIDDITVREVPAYDVAVTLLAPAKCTAGKQAEASAIIENMGENVARDFTVALLYSDGSLASEAVVAQLEPGAKDTLTFQFAAKVSDPEVIRLTAAVEYSRDLEDSNNHSSADVTVMQSRLPRVNDLAVTADGSLVWSAPSDEQAVVTEDFESYDAWAIDHIGEWTTVDGDGGRQTGLGNPDTGKQMPHSGTPFAWLIYNPYDFDLDLGKYPNYTPHSGQQFITAVHKTMLYYDTNENNDDWLISPELSGHAQTVTFYVGKYLDTYGKNETYEILYSATTPDTASFVLLTTDAVASGAWQQVSYELPDGARYFAIKYTAGDDNFTMFVDDVTYQMAVPEILGYKIYRNGQLVATVDAATTSFADDDALAADTYSVSVIYDGGESGLSNSVTGVVTAIGFPVPAEADIDSRDVVIYTVDGRPAASGRGAFSRIPRGVYIVKDKATGRVTSMMKK